MKKIRAEDIRGLPFGTKIVVTYPQNKHWGPSSYIGVKVATQIVYENGLEDDIQTIENQLANHICCVFIL